MVIVYLRRKARVFGKVEGILIIAEHLVAGGAFFRPGNDRLLQQAAWFVEKEAIQSKLKELVFRRQLRSQHDALLKRKTEIDAVRGLGCRGQQYLIIIIKGEGVHNHGPGNADSRHLH
jgi:hypothetical protein